ncbi:MAG: glucose-1-phosphate adenylyltransferase subunit GlgD [Bacilli bacterium]|nr:glucose-1-phosphate adenylyltransferase subunit GlgD [Bacilli bacterium]
MKGVIGFIDCHISPELGVLTNDRPLASSSFLGRYAFIDFALSNYCNSDIDNVGILVKNHQRSILKHLGNMMSWVENTKIGHETIFYNEKGILNPAYNSDINNIKQNDWVIYDTDADYLVFMPVHIIMRIDLRPILEEHILNGEDITVVYKKIENADESFEGENLFDIGKDGYVKKIYKNKGKKKIANASLSTWIISRKVLSDIVNVYHGRVDASFGMKEMIAYLLDNNIYKVKAHEFTGFARCFNSLNKYVDYSFEMLDHKKALELFNTDWPIYTCTHDTTPALYGEKATVKNSFVSNGCIVEGRVEDSILCRNVKIGKKSVIKNSIVLSNVTVSDSVNLNYVIIDKYATIHPNRTLEGKEDDVLYVPQGGKI